MNHEDDPRNVGTTQVLDARLYSHLQQHEFTKGSMNLSLKVIDLTAVWTASFTLQVNRQPLRTASLMLYLRKAYNLVDFQASVYDSSNAYPIRNAFMQSRVVPKNENEASIQNPYNTLTAEVKLAPNMTDYEVKFTNLKSSLQIRIQMTLTHVVRRESTALKTMVYKVCLPYTFMKFYMSDQEISYSEGSSEQFQLNQMLIKKIKFDEIQVILSKSDPRFNNTVPVIRQLICRGKNHSSTPEKDFFKFSSITAENFVKFELTYNMTPPANPISSEVSSIEAWGKQDDRSDEHAIVIRYSELADRFCIRDEISDKTNRLENTLTLSNMNPSTFYQENMIFEMVFLVDFSTSMNTEPNNRSRSLLQAIDEALKHLPAQNVYYIVIPFSNKSWFLPGQDSFLHTTKENLEKTRILLREQKHSQGTNLSNPISKALTLKQEKNKPTVRNIIFFTDGYLSESDQATSLNLILQTRSFMLRFFGLAIGTNCSLNFMEKLAKSTQGSFRAAADLTQINSTVKKLVTEAIYPFSTIKNLRGQGIDIIFSYPQSITGTLNVLAGEDARILLLFKKTSRDCQISFEVWNCTLYVKTVSFNLNHLPSASAEDMKWVFRMVGSKLSSKLYESTLAADLRPHNQ